ncbi:hypothetical protein LB577_05220 [Mesorhizobium sp. B283B1A]|uniref:hypothetical protein n=1 Tax=Mesorhizobium TaxID=68287 RepID=UPI001CD07D91|nr:MULTISPECIES: hypothetical protein [Mesorhizobium]MCA0046355.1 hypothetical protein [Mesorhizobium sp. B283B1A]UQS64307.1 hypothetical protein M5D98_30135 [Mesorhizobium opportunistum]
MDADRWERSCAQVQFFQMNGSAIHAAFPDETITQGRKQGAPGGYFGVWMGYVKTPRHTAARKGYARRRNCQMSLAGLTVNWRSRDLFTGRRIDGPKVLARRAEGAEMPFFNDLK